MSLEELKKLTDGVASLRAAIDAGTAQTTQEREAQDKVLKELSERLAKVEDEMRRDSISVPGCEKEIKNYSPGRAMRAWVRNDWKDAGLELDLHKQAYERLRENHGARLMTTLTPSVGGFLVPEEVFSGLLPKFDPISVCKKAGATVVRPSGYPFKVNKITGGTTATWTTEGASVSASDLSLGQVALNPHKVSARTVLTMEQIQFGSPSTDAAVLADLVKRTDLIQDSAALVGTGQQGQPIGIVNTTGINTAAGISTTPADKLMWADLSAAIQALEEDDVPSDKLALIVHPTQKGELFRNFASTISSGTFDNSGAVGVASTIFMNAVLFKQYTGIDLFTTTQMTGDQCIVGNMEDLWLAEWGGMVIGRSDVASDGTHHAFVEDKLHVKVTRWLDSAVIRPVSMHVITSI